MALEDLVVRYPLLPLTALLALEDLEIRQGPEFGLYSEQCRQRRQGLHLLMYWLSVVRG